MSTLYNLDIITNKRLAIYLLLIGLFSQSIILSVFQLFTSYGLYNIESCDWVYWNILKAKFREAIYLTVGEYLFFPAFWHYTITLHRSKS